MDRLSWRFKSGSGISILPSSSCNTNPLSKIMSVISTVLYNCTWLISLYINIYIIIYTHRIYLVKCSLIIFRYCLWHCNMQIFFYTHSNSPEWKHRRGCVCAGKEHWMPPPWKPDKWGHSTHLGTAVTGRGAASFPIQKGIYIIYGKKWSQKQIHLKIISIHKSHALIQHMNVLKVVDHSRMRYDSYYQDVMGPFH